MTLFGTVLRDVPVSIDPPPPGLAHDPVVAGRVGQGVLRHFVLTFDAPRRRIAARWRPITGS